MLTEQLACKNLDGLSIIGRTGGGRTRARAVSVSIIHNQCLSQCLTDVRSSQDVEENMHLKCFWPLMEKQSPVQLT